VSRVKRLDGKAAVEVGSSPAECLALVKAVERYPTWYPEVVRRVEVTERNPGGEASQAHATLHVAYGPLVKDFELLLAIEHEPAAVRLARIPHDRSDSEEFLVIWRINDGPRTRIELELDANLSVPRLLPVGAIGDGLAQGFVAAAARALEGSS
jgi:ribosome-associated toxin RatA of RatAB toxin-antitoxin module